MGHSRWAAFAGLGLVGVVATVAVVLMSLGGASLSPAPAVREASPAVSALPLRFEPNRGQTDPQVSFLSRGSDHALFLTSQGAVLKVARPDGSGAVAGFRFLGANPRPEVSGIAPMPGVSHYLARDPVTDVPGYARVVYRDVYDGVDVVYYGNRSGELEFDVRLAAGVDPARVQLDYSGATPRVDRSGALVLDAGGVQIRQPRPIAYQTLDGTVRELRGRYVLDGDRVSLQVAGRDPRAALVIDPELDYSTYLGGSGVDIPIWSDIDEDGNFYVTGLTVSADFPTTRGAYQETPGGAEDVFVTKLDPTGSRLVYSTYVGRADPDIAIGLDVDDAGNVVITGTTGSADFPTTAGAYQRRYAGGGSDAFVTKLNRTGSRILVSTFLGGEGDEAGFISFFDEDGNVFVEGDTSSADFPTTRGVIQPEYGGNGDGFVTSLNRSLSALRYSTFIGGSEFDGAHDGWLGPSGNFYIDGPTSSVDFPTTRGAAQRTYGGGDTDAFAAWVKPTGKALGFATYIGGSGFEDVLDLTIDRAGNVYVPGPTTSPDFPTTPGTFQPDFQGGGSDGYLVKLHRAGSRFEYATYVGGDADDAAGTVRVDRSGRAHVAGATGSLDFPVTRHAIQPEYGGGPSDAFLLTLDERGTKQRFGSFLGGSGEDASTGTGSWLDGRGHWYVPGNTDSQDFPTTRRAFQHENAGEIDAFVVKVDLDGH